MQNPASHRSSAAPLAILSFTAIVGGVGMLGGASLHADNAPAPSKHQMMKDCMAKQKASEAGRTHEDMKNSCKDVTKTEKENADKAAAEPAPTPSKQ
jgi:hypothetical protein